MLVPALLLLSLVFDRCAVVLKGFPGMLVLLLQGTGVAFVLCQPRREARNAFLQLGFSRDTCKNAP